MSIIFLILQWIAVVILLSVLVLMFLWMFNLMRRGSPFIPVSRSVLKEIDKVLGINDNSIVYDLGCGDGRVLFYLSKLHPNAKFIGIERSNFPLFLAKIGSFLNKKNNGSNVDIIRQDFSKTDLSKATHIFVYLRPDIMDNLLTKFDGELKSGTKLVSGYFEFTLKRPSEVYTFGKNKNDLRRKLFIYEF